MSEQKPDGVNDLLERDMQAVMALAGRYGEALARRQAERKQEMAKAEDQRLRDLQERFEAERSVMRTEMVPVHQERFWDTASAEDIGLRYAQAKQWEQHDDAARAARTHIEDEVKTRYGTSVEDYVTEKTARPETEQDVERETENRREDAKHNARQAARGDAENDLDAQAAAAAGEPEYDSHDRRQRMADRLSERFGHTSEGREAVNSVFGASHDQGAHPSDAVKASGRGTKARKQTSAGRGRENDVGLG